MMNRGNDWGLQTDSKGGGGGYNQGQTGGLRISLYVILWDCGIHGQDRQQVSIVTKPGTLIITILHEFIREDSLH